MKHEFERGTHDVHTSACVTPAFACLSNEVDDRDHHGVLHMHDVHASACVTPALHEAEGLV